MAERILEFLGRAAGSPERTQAWPSVWETKTYADGDKHFDVDGGGQGGGPSASMPARVLQFRPRVGPARRGKRPT